MAAISIANRRIKARYWYKGKRQVLMLTIFHVEGQHLGTCARLRPTALRTALPRNRKAALKHQLMHRYRRGLSSLARVQQEDSHADFKLNACPGSRTLPKEEQQAFLDALSLLTPMRDPQQDFSPGYPILSQYLSMIPWDTCD